MNVTLKEVDYEEKIFQMNDVILYFVYCFSKYMNNSSIPGNINFDKQKLIALCVHGRRERNII